MDTWGISGSTFLAIYGGLFVLTVALVISARMPGIAETTAGSVEDLDDYDVAVLSGGHELAVAVALVALDRGSAIELGDRMVRELAVTQDIDLAGLTVEALVGHGIGMEVMLIGPPPPGAHPVEAAVYTAVVESPTRRPEDIQRAAIALPALAAVTNRIVALGLVPDPAERGRRRRQCLWFAPLLLLGMVRLGAGASSSKPVLYLLGLLALTAGAMALTSVGRRKVRTRRGDQTLAALRMDETDSAGGPMFREPWDRERAGRSLALQGADELWVADRPLALAVGAVAIGSSDGHRSGRNDDGGHYFVWGTSDGGGDHGSDGHGGASDGGGGCGSSGCGGSGCGGGGCGG